MNKLSKEKIEIEIKALEKIVNSVGPKNGGKILMKIATMKKQMAQMP